HRLEVAGWQQAMSPPTTGDRGAVLQEEMRQARKALAATVARIRRIPGLESFLQEPDFSQIAKAVRHHGPLLYLVTTFAGSAVVIVHRPDEAADASAEVVWANDVTTDSVEAVLAAREGGEGKAWGTDLLTGPGPQLLMPAVQRLRELKA